MEKEPDKPSLASAAEKGPPTLIQDTFCAARPSTPSQPGFFTVLAHRADSQSPWALDLKFGRFKRLRVLKVNEGPISVYNEANPCKMIEVGDWIEKVNDISEAPKEMTEAMQTSDKLKLVVRKSWHTGQVKEEMDEAGACATVHEMDEEHIAPGKSHHAGVCTQTADWNEGMKQLPVSDQTQQRVRKVRRGRVSIQQRIDWQCIGGLRSPKQEVALAGQAPLQLQGVRAFVLNLTRRPDRRQHCEDLCKNLGLDHEVVKALDGAAISARQGSQVQQVNSVKFMLSWLHDSTVDPSWACQPHRTEGRPVRIRGDRDSDERWKVMACLLGHDEILSRIETANLEWALVLEDDCLPMTIDRQFCLTKKSRYRWRCPPPDAPAWNEIRSRYTAGIRWIMEQNDEVRVIYLGGILGFGQNVEGGEGALRVTVPGDFDKLLVQGRRTYQAHAYLIHRQAVPAVRQRLAEGYAADAALVRAIEAWDGCGCWRFSPSLLQQTGSCAKRDSDITGGRDKCNHSATSDICSKPGKRARHSTSDATMDAASPIPLQEQASSGISIRPQKCARHLNSDAGSGIDVRLTTPLCQHQESSDLGSADKPPISEFTSRSEQTQVEVATALVANQQQEAISMIATPASSGQAQLEAITAPTANQMQETIWRSSCTAMSKQLQMECECQQQAWAEKLHEEAPLQLSPPAEPPFQNEDHGISRAGCSIALVAAYLTKKCGMSHDDALALARQSRTEVLGHRAGSEPKTDLNDESDADSQ